MVSMFREEPSLFEYEVVLVVRRIFNSDGEVVPISVHSASRRQHGGWSLNLDL